MKITLTNGVEFTILVYLDGKLWDLDSGEGWPAVTGPYGKGPAPVGRYQIHPAVAISTKPKKNKSFTDSEGLAWFAKLEPLFETERTSLGIHPDGGVPGTEGCIGIKGSTKGLFDLLAKAKNVTLFVLT